MEDNTDPGRPGEQGSVAGMANPSIAPIYAVPGRKLGAVEHPMILKDVDKAIKTFGRGTSLRPVGPNPESKYASLVAGRLIMMWRGEDGRVHQPTEQSS